MSERIDPADLRCKLLEIGYHPLPLEGKAPPLKGWQKKLDSNPDEIKLWSKSYPYATNTGVLTKFTPAIDIDITDKEAAAAVENLIRDHFDGERLFVRIGKAPKRALLFRTAAPFSKLTLSVIAPNGDTSQKIEVLCDGQQLVVDGVHPEIQKDYWWPGYSNLGEVPHDALPELSEGQAQELLEDIGDLLVKEHDYKLADTRPDDGRDAEQSEYGPRLDWAEYTAKIITGRDFHDAVRDLAASHASCGLSQPASVRILESLMLASTTPRNERWKKRFEDIPRAVRTAFEKFGTTAKAAPTRVAPVLAMELRTMAFAPIKYVVPGIIVEGLTLLAGKPKLGKSWLLLHAAIAVARGGFTLGTIHCLEGDVLYCALEDNPRRLKSRLTKLLGTAEPWPKRLHYLCEMPRLIDGGLAVISEQGSVAACCCARQRAGRLR